MMWMLLGDTAPSSFAGIITAIGVVITALGGFILSFTVLLPMLRTTKSTHTIVNQMSTDKDNYIRELLTVLNENGIAAPRDQSKPGEVS